MLKKMVRQKRRNTKPNAWQKRPVFGFRMDQDVNSYLMSLKGVGLQSNFINKSIRLQIMLIHKPLNLLKSLKKRYPKTWVHVNRLKF